MLGHKTNLNTFKRVEIISSTFSNHNSMKLEIIYRKKNGKGTNKWRWNNTLIKLQWVNEEIKEEIRKYLKTNENGNTTPQGLWDDKAEVSWEGSRGDPGLPQETP